MTDQLQVETQGANQHSNQTHPPVSRPSRRLPVGRDWLGRAVLLLLWLGATAGVALLVARAATPSETSQLGALTASPISEQRPRQRPTVMLASQTIEPVISGDGVVVADGDDFLLEAPITPQAQAYQLIQEPVSVRALIVGGPAGFDCPWLGLGQGADGRVTMRCRMPNDLTVVPGLTGTMVLAMSEPIETMALPVAAVVGSAERGQVIVVQADGAFAVRDVELGVSDTFWIEITAGLDSDDIVLAAPVQADFRAGAS